MVSGRNSGSASPRNRDELAERVRSAAGEELRALSRDTREEVLLALLENPRLDEGILAPLLERRDLPGAFLEGVARRRDLMQSYPVKLRLARHPHTPRLVALPLIRQLYLFDLANLSLLPGVSAELKRLAEEQILARLPQLPLGQKLALAKRGAGRVAAALLAEGHAQVVPHAVDNAFLSEAHVLKVLADADLPEESVAALAAHRKWSSLYNVRLALVRHPRTPLARVLAFLPDLTMRDLQEISGVSTLAPNLREYLQSEISRRRKPRRRPE